MRIREISRLPDPLPGDDHPYRTGAWRPNLVEYDADELDVVEGAIPPELDGVYLRNTENPVLPALGRYHPFDGDGMIHSIRFHRGAASYRNRLVRTAGLAAELEARAPLWAGIMEPPGKSLRDGWGARTRMKDAASTDVIVHAGEALATFYQCGEPYRMDPVSLEQRGAAPWSPPRGVSAHPKVDPATGELFYFGYAASAPYLWWGALDARGERVHHAEVELPGSRLPHDMAITQHFVVLNDLPLFWDPELLAQGIYRPRWRPDLPSRFAVIPRSGGAPRWFEAAPTYVLHWINAYEDRQTIVLDGYFQSDPLPRPDPAGGPHAALKRMVDMHAFQTRPHRWRLDLSTGRCTEERLFDAISEFPVVNHALTGRRHRYVWSAMGVPGWFLFDGIVRMDLETGAEQRWRYPEGMYASEAPMAPRPGATAEDDGWVVTFVSDTVRDRSECHVFDAARIADGPIARIALPERICSGTHACWAPAASLRTPAGLAT